MQPTYTDYRIENTTINSKYNTPRSTITTDNGNIVITH